MPQPNGAAHRFDNLNHLAQLGSNGDANLNSLEMGGNVYQSPTGELLVNVTPLRLELRTGTVVFFDYAGATDAGVTPNATTSFWLDGNGTLMSGTGGLPDPAAASVFPLADVIAGATAISSVIDRRPRAVFIGVTPLLFRGSVAQVNALAVNTGAIAFATDGRKIGEGLGLGSGIQVYFDGVSWFRGSDDTVAVA